MKVKITTLSPVHIGTGKEITRTEFYNYYRINFDKLCDFIASKNETEFLNFLNNENNLTNISVNELISKFKLKSDEVIQNCAVYRLDTPIVQNTREIIKANNKVYLTGSSIKGSIRTALLFNALKNDSQFLNNYLNNVQNKLKNRQPRDFERISKDLDQELIEEVFHYGTRDSNGRVTFRDQQNDLLKVLHISDSNSLDVYENCEVNEIKVYALKKNGPHLNFSIYAECIKPFTEFEFDINIDIDFIKFLLRGFVNNSNGIGTKNFINADIKLHKLFGININNINNLSEDQIIKSIFNAWLSFGQEVSLIEEKFYKSLSNTQSFGNLNHLYSFPTKFKLGFGTGFPGMTIFPLLIKDSQTKTKAEQIYQTLGIGRHRNKSPMQIDQFPFTRKLKYNNGINAMGWVTFSNLVDSFKKISNTKTTTNIQSNQPAQVSAQQIDKNFIIAQIIDTKSKPPKVKILTGEHQGKETILPGVKLDGLGLKEGSKVYVQLLINKNVIQKANFKGRVSED